MSLFYLDNTLLYLVSMSLFQLHNTLLHVNNRLFKLEILFLQLDNLLIRILRLRQQLLLHLLHLPQHWLAITFYQLLALLVVCVHVGFEANIINEFLLFVVVNKIVRIIFVINKNIFISYYQWLAVDIFVIVL